MGRIFKNSSLSVQAGSGGIKQILGTLNQVNVVQTGSEVTLSTPQDIAPESQPTFKSVTISMPPGTSGTDAATVDYVLNLLAGVKSKGVVTAVMITTEPMNGAQVVDGIQCGPGDRVLRNSPDEPELNGIYDVQDGMWTRAINNDSWEEMPGAIVIAAYGDTFAGSRWVCDAEDGGTLDVTAIAWVMLRDPAMVGEAPEDGMPYVRGNGRWVVLAQALAAFWNTQVQPDSLPYYTASSGGGMTALTPFARRLLGDINDAAMRRTIEAFASFSTPLNIDLNRLGFIEDAGVYRQTSNDGATTENHYPSNMAGTLLVTPSAYGCQQEYTTYMDPRKYVRALTAPFNGTGPWSEWVEIQRILPWHNTNAVATVLGYDDDGAQVRRYYYEGVLASGSLTSNVKLIVNNGLMVEHPEHPGQWHSMMNIPPSESHISVLYTDGTLRLYLPEGSVWAGAKYKGYVTVVM